ncbi:MAG TPA: hypothetical protein VFJ74_00875 [Gemmatimonadaceae bacterium]|nr:hypothetical protein [Gemmatimonadaceae bacterium]
MRHHTDIPRRAAAAVVLLAGLSACQAFHSYFPSRDEVFKPVPVTLGEERVVAGDTAYVLTGRGYRLVTRDRDLLPDAKSALDRTSAAYRRFVAAEPAMVDVRLRLAPRRGAKPDTTRHPALPDTGRVVTMVAFRADDRGGRRGDGAPGGAMIGGGGYSTALAHAWLVAWADAITHRPAPASAAAVVASSSSDTSGRPAAAPRSAIGGGGGGMPADDPRIPDWIERAIPALVTGTPDPELVAARLAKQRDKLIPLRTLLATSRPSSGERSGGRMADAINGGNSPRERGDYVGAEGGGGRRGAARMGVLEGAALFDAEAMSVAAYLAEREGGAFVGDVYRTVVSGLTLADALRAARTLPHDVDEFERGWRAWLDVQAGKAEDYRNGQRAGGGYDDDR